MTIDNREGIDLDLRGYVSALKRRRSLGVLVFGLTLGCFACLAPFLERTYVAEGKLLFRRTDRTTSLTGIAASTDRLESLMDKQSPLGTEKEMLTSHTFIQRIIEEVGHQDKKGKPIAVKDFRKNLGIAIVGPTDVIRISYEAPDAQLALQTVETMMRLYIEGNLDKKQSETSEARIFVASQLPQMEVQLLEAEAELRQFKEANGIVDLSQEATLLSQGLEALQQKMIGVSADLNGVSQQTAQLQSNFQLSFGQTVAIDTLSKSPEIRGALDELAQVEQELAEAQQVFLPTHPRVMSIQDKRAMLENTLNSQLEQALGSRISIPKGLLENRGPRAPLLESYISLEIERLKLSQQFATLNEARTNYSNRASLMPQLESTQSRLQRNVDVARTSYQALLQKFQEVQLAENKSASNTEIIQPAALPDKGKTGRVMFLAAGTILGLLAASLAILIAEMRDNSLKTLSEIKGSFSYPLLGVIPTQALSLKGSAQQSEQLEFEHFLENEASPFINEAYWMIQENIRFLNAQRSLKVIVVTSSVPAEGKSMVAANLAATMARQGRRVMLVDANLRDPAQHHIWKLKTAKGLSNVLQGQTEFRPQRSPSVENLRILAAGDVVANPLHLLASQTMFSLVRSATHYFDHIILDAPPLLQAADALALGRLSDGILLVTRPGVIDRHSTAKAKEILTKHEQNILGLVVNGVNRGYFPNAHHTKGEMSREMEVSIR